MKLDDKYTQQSGSVYLTSVQVLVRLPPALPTGQKLRAKPNNHQSV
jgi:hypothetical protein